MGQPLRAALLVMAAVLMMAPTLGGQAMMAGDYTARRAIAQPVLVAGQASRALFLSDGLLDEAPTIFFSADLRGNHRAIEPVLETVRTVIFNNTSIDELTADLGADAGRLRAVLSRSSIVHVINAASPRLSLAAGGTYELAAHVRPVLVEIPVRRPTTEVAARVFRSSATPGVHVASVDVRVDDNPMVAIDAGWTTAARAVGFEFDTDRDGEPDSIGWLSDEQAGPGDPAGTPTATSMKMIPLRVGSAADVNLLGPLKEAWPDRPFPHFRLMRISILSRVSQNGAAAAASVRMRFQFFGHEALLVPKLIADFADARAWTSTAAPLDESGGWTELVQSVSASNSRFADAYAAEIARPILTIDGRAVTMRAAGAAATAAFAPAGVWLHAGFMPLEAGARTVAVLDSKYFAVGSVEARRVAAAPPQAGVPTIAIDRRTSTAYAADITAGAPFWLVFRENFHDGWRASLERDGAARPSAPAMPVHVRVNGFANAWYIDVPRSDEARPIRVALTFTPQRFVRWGAAVAVAAILACLAALAAALVRTRHTVWPSRPVRERLVSATRSPFLWLFLVALIIVARTGVSGILDQGESLFPYFPGDQLRESFRAWTENQGGFYRPDFNAWLLEMVRYPIAALVAVLHDILRLPLSMANRAVVLLIPLSWGVAASSLIFVLVDGRQPFRRLAAFLAGALAAVSYDVLAWLYGGGVSQLAIPAAVVLVACAIRLVERKQLWYLAMIVLVAPLATMNIPYLPPVLLLACSYWAWNVRRVRQRDVLVYWGAAAVMVLLVSGWWLTLYAFHVSSTGTLTPFVTDPVADLEANAQYYAFWPVLAMRGGGPPAPLVKWHWTPRDFVFCGAFVALAFSALLFRATRHTALVLATAALASVVLASAPNLPGIRDGYLWLYAHVSVLQAFRDPGKITVYLVFYYAAMAALAAAWLFSRIAGAAWPAPWRAAAFTAAGIALAAIPYVTSYPLLTGSAAALNLQPAHVPADYDRLRDRFRHAACGADCTVLVLPIPRYRSQFLWLPEERYARYNVVQRHLPVPSVYVEHEPTSIRLLNQPLQWIVAQLQAAPRTAVAPGQLDRLMSLAGIRYILLQEDQRSPAYGAWFVSYRELFWTLHRNIVEQTAFRPVERLSSFTLYARAGDPPTDPLLYARSGFPR